MQDLAAYFEPIRKTFPILHQEVNGKRLVYLDNAASTQMPQVVLDRIVRYHSAEHANVHRGVHTLSQTATTAFENARKTVASFINAPSDVQVIFTRGTTESLNLVAHAWGGAFLSEGDEIILSTLEHHSNIVPWQMLAQRTGAVIRVIPCDERGVLDIDAYRTLLNKRTKVVGFNHVSNALGTINPVQEMVAMARSVGAITVVDGAQAIAHVPVDVQALECDFYAFSSHKIFGPTGIGVLYGRREILDAMPPWQGGGDMIKTVSFSGSTWADLPSKFEAGTPSIAAGVGLGAALEFVQEVGLDKIAAYEDTLLAEATERVLSLGGIQIVGTAPKKASVLSMTMKGAHPHDIGTILDGCGVAVRTGHHCAQPAMERFGIPATARASFAFYNTKDDIDALIDGLGFVKEILA